MANVKSEPCTPQSVPAQQSVIPLRIFGQWAVISIVIIAAIGFLLADRLIDNKAEEQTQLINQQVLVQVDNQAQYMEQWLQGRESLMNQVTEADLVRLFATEVLLSSEPTQAPTDSEKSVQSALIAQIPYMQQLLNEFVQRHDINTAFLFRVSGEHFLGTQAQVPAGLDTQSFIKRVVDERKTIFSPLQATANGYVLDVFKPIYELLDEKQSPKVVAVMYARIPATSFVSKLLDVGELAEEGERNLLLQQEPENLALVETTNIQGLAANIAPMVVLNAPLQNQSLIDNKQAFMAFEAVPDSPFIVGREFISEYALEPFVAYRKAILSLISLIVIALVTFALAGIAHMLAARNRTRVKVLGQTMQALVRTVEIRDPYLNGHHERMARLSLNIANKMALSIPERSTVFYAAQLSGLGKTFVPSELFTKTGKLTPAERKAMEKHVDYAVEILQGIDFDLPITETVAQIHERLDGSGYPKKLKNGSISMTARILAVADAYCALTKPRSYREALSPAKALEVLRSEKGKYDEDVLNALEDLKE